MYAAFADTFAFEERADAHPGRRVRSAGPRAGRGGGRDHPVERPRVADLAQDRTRAAGRVHGRAQGLARRHPARRTSWPRSPRPSACRRACSTWSPRIARCRRLLVRDPRVDKITFTGSTAAGRRIASLCGERIARCTLELGGKSAAVILDDIDLDTAASTLARVRVLPQWPGVLVADPDHRVRAPGRTRSSTRSRSRFAKVAVGDPFDPATQMGPLVAERQRDRVLGYVAKGVEEGARARHRRWSPRAPRPRVVRRADGLRRRRQLVDHRAGGDLRPGAHRDPCRRRAGCGPPGERHDLRAQRLGVHRRRGAGAGRRGPAPLRHRRAQRVPDRLRDRVRWLQAVRDRAGRAAPRVCCRSSRPRPSSSRTHRPDTATPDPTACGARPRSGAGTGSADRPARKGGTGRGDGRVHGLQVKPPPRIETGSVQSGPSAVVASGRVTNASGPAWCSPLNGVTPVKPHGWASAGLLNQNPRWKVFVGASAMSLSTPKIWSRRTVRIVALARTVRVHVEIGLVPREARRSG